MKLLQFLFILGTFWKGQYILGSKLVNDVYVGRKLLVEGGADGKLDYVFFSDKVTITAVSAEKVVAGKEGGDSIPLCAKPNDDGVCGDDKIALTKGAESNGVMVFSHSISTPAPKTTEDVSGTCKLHGWGKAGGEGGGEGTTAAGDAPAEEAAGKRSIIKRQAAELKAIPVTVTAGDGGSLEVKSTADTDKMFAGDAGGAIVCGDKLAGILVSVDDKGVGKGIKVQVFLPEEGDSAGDGGAGGTTGAPGGDAATISASMVVTTLPILAITFFTY
ncbi:hypothetical protein Trydic_g20909 [Trypoxylus dichotomus]